MVLRSFMDVNCGEECNAMGGGERAISCNTRGATVSGRTPGQTELNGSKLSVPTCGAGNQNEPDESENESDDPDSESEDDPDSESEDDPDGETEDDPDPSQESNDSEEQAPEDDDPDPEEDDSKNPFKRFGN
jgi:cobalamin biosynthesis protein CobT